MINLADFSDEDFEDLVGPIALAAVLTGVVGQVSEIQPWEIDGVMANLANWPTEIRENALRTLRADASEIARWAQVIVDAVDNAG